MSGTQFAMVSKWMPNGNIDQYVKTRPDANRFELVSFPSKLLFSLFLVDDPSTSVARRCRQGFDIYAPSGNGPR